MMRRFGCRGVFQRASVSSPNANRVAARHASIRELVRTQGIPLVAYYLLLNESCVLFVTYLLHNEWLGTGDIVSALEYVGLGHVIDVKKVGNSSTTIFGFEVSGKLVMNFTVASAFMSLWTPLQLPFCMATLPIMKRWLRFGRKTAVPPVAGV